MKVYKTKQGELVLDGLNRTVIFGDLDTSTIEKCAFQSFIFLPLESIPEEYKKMDLYTAHNEADANFEEIQ